MKQEKRPTAYLVVIAICLALIGLIAAYYMPMYENAVQGTSEKGIYNVLKQISTMFSKVAAVLFIIFIALTLIKKMRRNKSLLSELV